MGGGPAPNEDFIDAVYGNFPLMIALIALITFILLARAFRSLLLPPKAVLLNVLSVAAAWGVLALVWQQGHGSDAIWGIDATGSMPSWIPLMVFAFLFGLSMDYEVFILARMREEFDAHRLDRHRGGPRHRPHGPARHERGADPVPGLRRRWPPGPGTDVKMLATGLAAGILLDATVIRALLVPAVVSLFGRWNWWLPRGPRGCCGSSPRCRPGSRPAGRTPGSATALTPAGLLDRPGVAGAEAARPGRPAPRPSRAASSSAVSASP